MSYQLLSVYTFLGHPLAITAIKEIVLLVMEGRLESQWGWWERFGCCLGNKSKGINLGKGLADVSRGGTGSGVLSTGAKRHPQGAGKIWEAEQCPGGTLPFRTGQRQRPCRCGLAGEEG